MAKVFGVKVSRKGYDVKTAGDKQLAFSSQWPLLPIEAEGEYSIASGTQTYTIYTHNLGYVPVFMCWEEDSSGNLEIMDASYRNVYADDTSIIYSASYSAAAFTLHYKVFRRPLLKNYESDILTSTDATEVDSGDYGVIVSLPGKDISSTDKRDFCLRSDVRQLMVHKTGYYDDSTNGRNITHSLGYNPMYWFYIENTNRNPAGCYNVAAETDDFSISSTDTVLTYTYYGYPFLAVAYLIFKDPLNEIG